MKEFWFIRHGESETNAGLPAESDASTPLTDKGMAQASSLPDAIGEPPDIFVLSPYIRTHQTAAPVLEKFPRVAVETWPIQEFSYFTSEQYYGTVTSDRRKISAAYFRRGDPNLILGEGAESFNQFIFRVDEAFKKLVETKHKRVILFGHGWFIRAGLWRLITQAVSQIERREFLGSVEAHLQTAKTPLLMFKWLSRRKRHKAMDSFILFSAAVSTPNCAVIKYNVTEAGKIKISGYSTRHLKEDLLATSLNNR